MGEFGEDPSDVTGTQEAAQWLLLHGAIPSDDEGQLNELALKNIFHLNTYVPGEALSQRKVFLRWAEDACFTHNAFFAFLLGSTHVQRRPERSLHTITACSCLSGYDGIRKRIAGYVGVITGRKLRTVRGVIKPLKESLKDCVARRKREYGLRCEFKL